MMKTPKKILRSSKTRVLVVDDSAMVRRILTEQLAQDTQIEVVGVAKDAYAARDKIVQLNPDVITLDLEMPRMNGLSFLKKLMKHYPMPVVIVSSYTARGGYKALQALELGAVDIIPKPGMEELENIGMELREKVKIAAYARFFPRKMFTLRNTSGPSSKIKKFDFIIAIGASTGGTEALTHILTQLPSNTPGVLVVQHMPAIFTRAFALRLDEQSSMSVKEAEDGDLIEVGKVLIAPGNFHMHLDKTTEGKYCVAVSGGKRVCYHRPSVEVLFRSMAREAGAKAIGVVLTGMGSDGACGLLEMKKVGAKTIAQDEDSCVVFGMPKKAIDLGGVDEVVSLDNIAKEILNILK